MDMVLKRRLIGASILIALAVIFVPMLLVDPDSVAERSGERVDVPPMPESAGEVRRIPLDPDTARLADGSEPGPGDGPGGQADAASVAVRDRPGEIAGADEPVSADAAAGSGESRADEEIVLRPELTEAAGPDRAGSDDPAADRPDAAGPEPDAESAPDADEAAVPARPEAGEAGISLGDFIVQVASFGTEASANRVREQLEALGHIVQRDEIVRGETLLYRLRTGPYPSRAAAENALEQIRTTIAGVEPIVREVDAALQADDEPGFAVQVGSFVGQDNAEGETERLRSLGFDAIRFSERVGEREIWRVVVGPVDERAAAEALQRRLAAEAGVEGLVVSYP